MTLICQNDFSSTQKQDIPSPESPPASRLVISSSERSESGAGLSSWHAESPLTQTKPDRIPRDTWPPHTELIDNCMDVCRGHLIQSKTNSIDKPVCLAHFKSNCNGVASRNCRVAVRGQHSPILQGSWSLYDYISPSAFVLSQPSL